MLTERDYAERIARDRREARIKREDRQAAGQAAGRGKRRI